MEDSKIKLAKSLKKMQSKGYVLNKSNGRIITGLVSDRRDKVLKEIDKNLNDICEAN